MSTCPVKNYYGENNKDKVPRTLSFHKNNKSNGTPHNWENDRDEYHH